MQPKNPNNTLKNGHVWIAGMSGSGKTYFTQNKLIQDKDQVIAFDPQGDYSGKIGRSQCRVYHDIRTFAAAVLAGRKTKQGFKIIWNPRHVTTWEDLDLFCKVAWAAGNGQHSHMLKVVCEELADNSKSTQFTSPYHRKLLMVGRKFGIHTINCFQRGQDVSKTIIDNCHTCVVMMQKTSKSAKYLEDLTGIPASEIDSLPEYHHIKQVGKQWTKGK
ncbi:type IV secretory system conjugative DNA transfer family protein [Vibrio tubiashii]|uniref:type IV secretory system conjugative DNA transfer family protein n=1 Tax=Vibrio tubiashii TaxID=29498 RepID=UPI001EFD4A5B|nr:type IV secretory system conjugative DNA transfer family protein [Vibrio tubiashii]MCG9576424.1 type IV secretory system conjugative DNA transfer family protein [Vibrio tubiashii]